MKRKAHKKVPKPRRVPVAKRVKNFVLKSQKLLLSPIKHNKDGSRTLTSGKLYYD